MIIELLDRVKRCRSNKLCISGGKEKVMKILENRFLLQSISLVALLLIITLVVYLSSQNTSLPMVEFRVIEAPKKLKTSNVLPLNAAPVAIPKKKAPPKKKKKKKGREVFGTNKKTLRSDSVTAIKTKQGNTIAKEVDQKLKKGDEEALPIPEEDYLVTAIPKVLSEFRAPYPAEAKIKELKAR